MHWTSHQLNVNRGPHHPPTASAQLDPPTIDTCTDARRVHSACTTLVEVGTPVPPATATRLFGSRNTGPPGGAASARLARPTDRILRNETAPGACPYPTPRDQGPAGPELRADAPLMPTVSRTRTTHCLRSFWKPGSRHFGLALTGTQPRTTEAQCRGPAPVPGSGPECADVPGPAVCVRARVHVCGQPGPRSAGLPCGHSCSVGLAVVLAPKA